MSAILNNRLAVPFLPYVILVLAVWVPPALGQTSVVGRVEAGGGAPVSFANVQLLALADSSAVAGTLAQDDGSFRLEVTRRGDYLLYVSLIGYESFMSEGIRLNGQEAHDVGIVRLDQSAIEMEELSVEARRNSTSKKRIVS